MKTLGKKLNRGAFHGNTARFFERVDYRYNIDDLLNKQYRTR